MKFSPIPLSDSLVCLENVTLMEIFELVYKPQRPNVRKSTFGAMHDQLRRWVTVMADCPADKVNRQTLIEFRDKCVSKGLTAATINGSVKTIVNVMRAGGVAVDYQGVMLAWQAPAQKLTLDELSRVWAIADQAKWPNARDYRAHRIDGIPGAWWRAFFMLAYSTGLRRSDLFGLRWDQVEQVCIRATFSKGARPKLIPITEPLKPWLRLLSSNKTETVLGRSDTNAFDLEFARLRKLAGLDKLTLERIRYLSSNEWERAGKGCGGLILKHKRGLRVSEINYRKLATVAHALEYPSQVLIDSKSLEIPKLFLDAQNPANAETRPDVTPAIARLTPQASSLDTFTTFFTSSVGNASDRLGSMTLRRVFEKSLLEILLTDDAAPATINGYRQALTHWERLTDNRPISRITTEYLQEFRKAAKAETHISPATVNKWFRGIRSILNHLGPRSNSNRRSRACLRYFDEVPWLDNLKEEEPDPIHIEDEQINRIYEHCTAANWPAKEDTGCEPRDWWRCALVVMVNYGQRRDDWYYLPAKAVSFEKGTVVFTAKKTEKRHDLVLNEAVTWHLRKVNCGSRDLVFRPTQAHHQLYREWHRIQDAAGVADPNGEAFTFKAMRATAAARYHEYFPGTAELLLGHALRRDSKVTSQHYLGKARLKPLWNAIRNIPQPSAFVQAMTDQTGPQFGEGAPHDRN